MKSRPLQDIVDEVTKRFKSSYSAASSAKYYIVPFDTEDKIHYLTLENAEIANNQDELHILVEAMIKDIIAEKRD